MAKWLACLTTLPFLMFAGHGSTAATISVADLSPNDLVITEYLADPVGISDAEGEYFEIFNATNATVDLTDLVVKDDGSNSFNISGISIGPRSFSVFSSSDGTGLGLVPDFIYGGSMSLTNTDDEIGLFRPDDTLIHKLSYTDGDFYGDGVAHELGLLGIGTPSLVQGPSAGTDFVAAVASLPAGNFGSPGFAGSTQIDLPAIPIPAAVWLFGSALGLLAWTRRAVMLTDKT